jgi:tRNA (mo5U34)-methyltransferase
VLAAIRSAEWFYRIDLPDGTTTRPYVPRDGATIRDARWEMVERVLAATFGGDLSSATAIDFACHQGWFTAKLVAAGVWDVLGVDVRGDHVAAAAHQHRARKRRAHASSSST